MIYRPHIPHRGRNPFRMRAERIPKRCGIHSARIRNIGLIQEPIVEETNDTT